MRAVGAPPMLWTLGAGLVSHGVAVWRRLGSLSWSKLAGPADAADVRGGAGVARVLREAGASPLLCRGAVVSSGRGCSDASLAPRRDFPLRGGVEVGPVVLRLGGGVRAGGVWGAVRFLLCGEAVAGFAAQVPHCVVSLLPPICAATFYADRFHFAVSSCGVFAGARFFRSPSSRSSQPRRLLATASVA